MTDDAVLSGDAELLAVFQDEAAEAIDALAQLLIAMRAGESPQVSEQVAAALRVAHNIKGAARVAGVRKVEMLAHAIEDGLSPFRISGLCPSSEMIDQLTDAIAIMGRTTRGEPLAEAAGATVARIALLAASAQPASHGTTPDKTGRTPAPAPASIDAAATVRVPIQRLDYLMTFAAEMLDAQTRLRAQEQGLRDLTSALELLRGQLPHEHRRTLEPLQAQFELLQRDLRSERLAFGHLSSGFNEAVRRLRMLPINAAAERWRRTVRETAQELGKRVELQLELSDLEIDKHILDALADPMMHLLRNAVAHGIEAPAERAAAAKPALGRVFVSAAMADGNIRIEVMDDGRGFDLTRMRARAQELGLAAGSKPLSDEATAELGFLPGFSTALKVDAVSGRGVGLDVVRSQLEAFGGKVSASPSSALGGARILVVVPPSIVSTHGLLVSVGAITYALPISNVEKTLVIAAAKIENVDGASVIRVPEREPLRIVSLGALMGQKVRTSKEGRLTLVIVSHFGLELGLIVDELLGEEEFVTKRLPWNLRRVDRVSGVVALGHGVLGIVVNVPSLLRAARGRDAATLEADNTRERRRLRILVADDSLTSRTLERNILSAAGYEVEVAADGEQAWQRFNEVHPDLVVSDVDMPRLNGLELTRRIRTHATRGKVPVVLVTSLERPEDLAAGAAAGADEYIVKGRFDQQTLLEAVTRLT